MPIKDFKFDELRENYEKANRVYLIAAGEAIQNQMVDFAHVDTGTLKNSITYRLKDGTRSEFGTIKGSTPPEEARISPPDKADQVRVGSALTYAQAQEKANGWASKGFDTVIAAGDLQNLAKELFGRAS